MYKEKRMGKKKMGKGLDALLDWNGGAESLEPIKNQAENDSGGAKVLRTSEIEPDRKQPRTVFDEAAIDELADSVSQHGILQPILVRPFGGGYRIVAGERRWRAAMKAGLREVPVIVRDMTDLEAAQISLIENLQRESLNPIEEALGYKRLVDEFFMTQEQIAEKVGKSRPVIANALRLLNLPEEVRQMLSDGQISPGHAKVLAGVENHSTAVLYAKKAAEEKLSVRQLEKLVGAGSKEKTEVRVVSGIKKPDPFLTELEIAMTRHLSHTVKVKKEKGGRMKLDIEFESLDELKSFAKALAVRTADE